MRFMYLFFMFLATINLIIVMLCGLTGKNIYKIYGKRILKELCKFVLLLIAFYIALAISGLGS